jgi:aerobic C4-dicarboxylate transport protein
MILCSAGYLNKSRKNRHLFLHLLQRVSNALFKVVHIIMKLAPIGTFGAIAFTVGKFGGDILYNLIKLMGEVYLICGLFIFIILGTIARLSGFSLIKLLKHIKNELFLAISTSSGEVIMPSLMKKLEEFGCNKTIVGLVLPAGYSFNMDGTSIYLTMASLFIAQATNTPLDLSHQITLLAILMLTSKGTAAVPGGGFITLAATLSRLCAISGWNQPKKIG